MTVSDQDLKFFVQALKTASYYDLSDYSEKSLKRRIQKILTDNKMDINTLVGTIKTNPAFTERVLKDITVNTTELFRDPTIWHTLRYRVLPKLENNKNINIWHAGCSTGQEVYSMMILLKEMGLFDKAKIFATDINTDVLEQAKKGLYKFRFNIGYLDNFDKVIKQNPYNYDEYTEVPYEKYFRIDKLKDEIFMNEELKEKPIYRKHDLVKDGNLFFAKFDIILCRNVIIYFNYNLQNKVFELFHSNLYTKGALILGMHETILGPMAQRFDKKGYAYYKK